ncbi:MAG TPA: hypothetical protein VG936_02300 [Lacunisphaera sp.]|nr:hypothetical protein [Lacunisphaera sp.]
MYSDIILHGVDKMARGKDTVAAIRSGAKAVNVILAGESHEYLREIQAARERAKKLTARFGVSPTVFLRTSIVFDSRDNRGGDDALTEREFRVLCALYSYIGDKPFSQVALSKIQERAAGAKTRAMLVALAENERGPIYTPKEIRTAIANLHAGGKGWFSRVTYRQHKTYYSHRLSIAELIEQVAQKEAAAKARRSAADSELLQRRIDQLTPRLANQKAAPGQP